MRALEARRAPCYYKNMKSLNTAIKQTSLGIFIWVFLDIVFAAGLVGLFVLTSASVRAIVSLRSEVAALSAMSSQLTALSQDSKKAESILPQLRRMLPDSDQLLFASSEFSELARRLGVEFGFQFGNIHGGDAYQNISFTMTLGGTFPQLTRYLEKLGELPYFIKISKIDLSTGAGAEVFRATMSGIIFIK